MVKKVMKSNEKKAVKAENAERRHRNLILADGCDCRGCCNCVTRSFHKDGIAAQTRHKRRRKDGYSRAHREY